MKGLVFGIDFDGTCVKHSYPEIGQDIGAIPVLRELVENGHRLMLFTMRSGEELDQAVKWFEDNKLPLYGVNVNPTQHNWTKSPKAYANMYIDDAALGAPLAHTEGSRPWIDWVKVRQVLLYHGFIGHVPV